MFWYIVGYIFVAGLVGIPIFLVGERKKTHQYDDGTVPLALFAGGLWPLTLLLGSVVGILAGPLYLYGKLVKKLVDKHIPEAEHKHF